MTRILLPEGVEPLEEGDDRTSKAQEATKRPRQSLENFLTSNVPEGAVILPPGQFITADLEYWVPHLLVDLVRLTFSQSQPNQIFDLVDTP